MSALPETLDALPLKDLSRRWNCSLSTLRRKLNRGHLPQILLPGSTRPLVPLDAIRAAEQPQAANPNPEKLTIL
ncbi:MAG: hypothetical protein ACKV19_14255 [Verrucomicrobiales bacterium]